MESALGSLGVLVAVGLLMVGGPLGPARTCQGLGPATGICLLPWNYQSTNSDRTTAYALVGFLVIIAGSILILRKAAKPLELRSLPRGDRRLMAGVVVLGLVGVVLVCACVAAGYTAPPSQTVTLSNAQLADVGNLYTPYYGIERAATVYLQAGEAVAVTYTVTWYAAGSTAPQAGVGLPATIAPIGEPVSYANPSAAWYVVPKTGSYTVWFFAEYPSYAPSWTSNSTMTITAYNVGYVPTVQLALGALGYVAFAAAVVVDGVLHPRGPLVRRAPPHAGGLNPPSE